MAPSATGADMCYDPEVIRDRHVWDYLNRFLGCGPKQPRFVFVGLEERAHPGDEARNIDERLAHPDVFGAERGDKDAALGILYRQMNAEDVPQWRIAASLVTEIMRERGEDVSDTSVAALGKRDSGDSFLAELLPVPQQSNRTRKNRQRGNRPKIYPVRRFGFRGTTAYYRAALGRNVAGRLNRDGSHETVRWKALRALIQVNGHPPDYIICYGVTWRAVFNQLVEPWELEVEPSHRCIRKLGINHNGSLVAITGFFTQTARPESQDVTLADCRSLAACLSALQNR